MKKKLLIIAIAAAFFAACKKDRTCTCTHTVVSQTSTQPGFIFTPQSPTITSTKYSNIKKSNPKAQNCVTEEVTFTGSETFLSGSSTVNYVTTTVTNNECILK